LLIATFVVYLAMVAALTIVPAHLSPIRIRSTDANHINLIPLDYSFRCFRQGRGMYPHLTAFCLRNTLGNVALFMPLGILLPFIDARFRTFKRVLLFGLAMSLAIETAQLALRFIGNPRAVDIDDVLLNTLGGCLGFLIYRGLKLRPLVEDGAGERNTSK
jgi:glycopeptide antibiotics resistance protein